MVVKELHGILELVSCDYVGDNIYITYRLLDHRGGNGCHGDGGERVG